MLHGHKAHCNTMRGKEIEGGAIGSIGLSGSTKALGPRVLQKNLYSNDLSHPHLNMAKAKRFVTDGLI